MPASLGQRKARGEGETGDSGLTPGFFRFLLKVGRPPFPSPSRPHPRVQRGRGLPQAAASASSPRGSWCLPGPTGLTRTTQPQDVRSDGTTASCHAPPLPPPPASSPPRISPPTPPSRAQDESKGEGERFTSYVQGRVYLCYPLFLLFRNSTFLLNRSEIGLGGRGPEAGHGLGGEGWTSGGNPQIQRSIENRKKTMGGRSTELQNSRDQSFGSEKLVT
ncbi:uncharacterized protein LOC110572154 [Neomonachus schauinslandi]|uniref:Uncharacterized protein LOC110572154 n=1 Tax=Neomonachus schauinslandi TaxID=29088 RepID=A0A8M1M7N0_NEOSC|nr:uncharacterized protein LOC110572154 [Neomonachus schauinslandi]